MTEDGDEGSDSEVDVDDSQTQTTCSDTNEVLHMFMSDGYVPKISDMGLGKFLVFGMHLKYMFTRSCKYVNCQANNWQVKAPLV